MKRAAAAAGKVPKAKKAVTNGHILAKPLPEGLILTDLMKNQWKVGKPIGCGGFGLLYLAQPNSSSPVADNAQYVIKVEPMSNGPLFCELHFYQRAAKPDAISQWMTAHGLKSLGVPRFIAAGHQEHNSERYRFMVMERFGSDLQKLFEQAGKRFPTHTVFMLGLKLLDVLEYIHDKEYVHADIKAANLLVGHTDPQQVYLVDYGLAFRYTGDSGHKEYCEDPKRTHDGTIEFTSRDAHRGVAPSRRGDLEILGYCMVQWLCRQLPWEDNLNNKNYVRDQKIRYMSDIPAFMAKCFSDSENIPIGDLSAYLIYVVGLKYDERPDYNHCRAIFTRALKSVGAKPSDRLDFAATSTAKLASPPAKAGRKRAIMPQLPSKLAKKPMAAVSAQIALEDSEDEIDNVDYEGPTKRKVAKKAASLMAAVPKVANRSPLVVAKSASVVARSSPCRARARSIKSPPSSAKSPSVAARTPSVAAVAPVRASSLMKSSASMSRSPRVASTTLTPSGAAVKKGRRIVRRRQPAGNLATTATQTTPGLAHQ